MEKKLPYLVIKGSPQELVEIETLLVMAGYNNPYEHWNNDVCSHEHSFDRIILYSNGVLKYHYHPRNKAHFRASDIDKILNKIEEATR